MIEIGNKKQCNGCHACASVCPKQCITMSADEEGFLYPKIDAAACTNCGLCEKICPVLHKKPIDETMLPKAYAAYNIDEEIRMQSSSGGLFTLFATAIIKRGGVVFGASFNERFEVVHTYAENVEALAKFRGSKYVQSTIGDSYKQAETFLKQGRWVLFTGTPCQIGGLYAYLKKEYETLVTQDIICHGVPSPLVWKKYLNEKKKNLDISKVSFRNKEKGWKQFSMTIHFADGSKYSNTLGVDPMMKTFLSNWCLRPSCYDCAFKTKKRQSDYTLADYWGIENVHPEMFDDKGVSLLLIHTAKGESLFTSIKSTLTYVATDTDKALSYNRAAIMSVKMPKIRNRFMRDIASKSFIKAFKHSNNKWLFHLKRYLSAIKRKLFH